MSGCVSSSHELRNLVNTAIVAFEVLKTGSVGLAGNTGAVLNRSLTGLRDLIARSLDEVRSTSGVKTMKRMLVAEFIDEVGAAATLAANARGGITLIVHPRRRDWRSMRINTSSRRWSEIYSRTRSRSPGPTVP